MPFRNPITSLPASKITSGTFTGNYVNAGSFTLAGDPAHSHVQAAATSLVFYAADGVTPLISMDTSTAIGTITAARIRTAATGNRIELGAVANEIDFYSGTAGEIPGSLSISGAAGVQLTTPNIGGFGVAGFSIHTPDATHTAEIDMLGNLVTTYGIFSGGLISAVSGVQDNVGNYYPRWAKDITQRAIDAGTAVVTTDASAYATVTHSLGVVPLAVLCTSKSPTSGSPVMGMVLADTYTSTTFRVRCLSSTGAGIVSTPNLAVAWLAIG